MKKFIHIGFNANEPRFEIWEDVFDKATDWLRYAPNCWILCTGQSPKKWLNHIKPHLKEGERVFVCELNISNRQGWLSKSTWEWIRKTRLRT